MDKQKEKKKHISIFHLVHQKRKKRYSWKHRASSIDELCSHTGDKDVTLTALFPDAVTSLTGNIYF